MPQIYKYLCAGEHEVPGAPAPGPEGRVPADEGGGEGGRGGQDGLGQVQPVPVPVPPHRD